MTCQLSAQTIHWEMNEPFRIARGEMTHVEGIVVRLTDGNGRQGRGEAYGINYEGETTASMLRQIDEVRERLLADPTRDALRALLPHGGARCALDCALWDLESKQSGVAAWRRAGVKSWQPIVSAYTIGMRPAAELEATVALRANYPLLKIKVNADHPLDTIRIVHAAAPRARLIVDANQSWSFEALTRYAPACRDLGVVLLEQPISADADDALLAYDSPLPICADEVVHVAADLPRVIGKYALVNIKLDKSGGLTAALDLAHAALQQGLRLMVGCMAGSSLAMAPAVIVAQLCDFVDLDGPLLQRQDWPHGIHYDNGTMSLPETSLWG
jgi:L-alanine-DL-glutamate epimerase-like enolase superfamily enzyme